MGFTGAKARKFKRAYIAQFNAMEEELKRLTEQATPIASLQSARTELTL